MGRKRAAFAEGIAEEEQQYAQVLRDIRDERGETQQALGRLVGWSVSTVSRFEAAAERPDEATHRRYCALAPTEELREQAVAAYETLPALPAKHAAPVRKELGVRTIFNILGPLTNPAGAPNILMGVFHPDLVGIQVRVLQRLGASHALVVWGRDNLDEVTLGSATMFAFLSQAVCAPFDWRERQQF